jgi:cellulase/cellobiase CelA1
VNYVIQSDWGNGATISVTIINNSASAVNGWTLAFTFPGNQTITNLWNGTYTQNGASVSVKDAGYNATIGANGGSTNFGFNLNYSGSNAKPTSFTLNGTACTVQ